MLLRRQQRLEEEHAEIEYQIRCLMCQPEATKTDFDKQKEETLIQRYFRDILFMYTHKITSIELCTLDIYTRYIRYLYNSGTNCIHKYIIFFLYRLVEIVERRNEIVECLEMDRRREVEEDKSINKHMGLFVGKQDNEFNLIYTYCDTGTV